MFDRSGWIPGMIWFVPWWNISIIRSEATCNRQKFNYLRNVINKLPVYFYESTIQKEAPKTF